MSEIVVGQTPRDDSAPVSQRQLVEGLFNTLLDLIEVLESEVDSVRTRSAEEMRLLQEDKRALTATYEAHLRSLRRRPDALRKLDEQERAEMRAVTDRFQEALVANERALRAAKSAADGVLETIANAARQERANLYGDRGAPRAARDKRAIPLSLNARY